MLRAESSNFAAGELTSTTLDCDYSHLDDLSAALDLAFPKFNMGHADAKFQADKACLDRLCQELHSTLQPNVLKICFDAPFFASTAGDLVWGDESREVYLPIRQPIGHASSGQQLEFQTDEMGLVSVRIREKEPKPPKRSNVSKEKQRLPQKQKAKVAKRKDKDNNRHKDNRKKAAADKDPLDSLRSSDGQCLASGAALKTTARLVKLAMQKLASDRADELIVHRLKLDKDCGTVRMLIEFWPEYYRISTPSPGYEKTTDDHDRLVTFEFPVESATDSTDDRQVSMAVSQLDPTAPRLLELRITPVLRLPDEDDLQAIATPAAAALRPGSQRDTWTLQYPMEEAAVLTSLARADRGLRLRVWRGVAELCQREPGLLSSCMADRRLAMHCLMELAESEIHDSAGGSSGQVWHRANYGDCTRRLLRSLRDCLMEGRVAHFFNRQLNLLGHMRLSECRAAAAKLDFFLRKPAALVRAARRAALTGLPLSEEEDRESDD